MPCDLRALLDAYKNDVCDVARCSYTHPHLPHPFLDISGTIEREPGWYKKKIPKINWVADTEHSIPIQIVEYDHILSKSKIEKEDNFLDHLRSNTRATTDALGNGSLRNLREGQFVQLERRGFYRCDAMYRGPGNPLTLVLVPDGKFQAMSILTTKLEAGRVSK